jgi:hypothetical protein
MLVRDKQSSLLDQFVSDSKLRKKMKRCEYAPSRNHNN